MYLHVNVNQYTKTGVNFHLIEANGWFLTIPNSLEQIGCCKIRNWLTLHFINADQSFVINLRLHWGLSGLFRASILCRPKWGCCRLCVQVNARWSSCRRCLRCWLWWGCQTGTCPPLAVLQPVECAPVSVTCNTCPPLEPALLHQTKDAKDESALHQQAFISGTRASP